MRIGLFGGTFNPIHRGHLWAASEVKKQFNLNQIILIPAALPPHKTPGLVANADDRLEMINLAIADFSGLMVSDVELNRPGLSYTIDTIQHFKYTLTKDAGLYLIMGLDAFLEIHTWKSHQDLLEEIAFIVIARPDHNYTDAQQGWRIIDTYLKSTLSSDSQFDAERACYTLEGKQPVYVCDIKALDISSTNIREMIKKKQSIENLLPPEVADYIRLKGLYK
ncbi:MAG: nicotinate-nucleotide adenylyltransferase [Desulfobacterales bacterium]|jgi:nicotinate-nucleotide adenylyltransferase